MMLWIFAFQCVAANVHGGWRKGYYFRVNLQVGFSFKYILPGETEQKSMDVDGNTGFVEMGILLADTLKFHINSGDFSIWFQVKIHEEEPVYFQFEWIQLLYKDQEIGRIHDSEIYPFSFISQDSREYLQLTSKPVGKYYGSFEIDVTKLCVSWAYGYFNPIGYYDECKVVLSYPPKPLLEIIPVSTAIITTKKPEPLTTQPTTQQTTILKTDKTDKVITEPPPKPRPKRRTKAPADKTNIIEASSMKKKLPSPQMNISNNEKTRSGKVDSTIWIIVGVIIGTLVVIVLFVVCVYLCIRRKRRN